MDDVNGKRPLFPCGHSTIPNECKHICLFFNFISEFDLSPGLHSVQVLAFKMVGKGVLSECVVTRTDEEGTQNDFLVLFVLLLLFFP